MLYVSEKERERDMDVEAVNTGPCNSSADSIPLAVLRQHLLAISYKDYLVFLGVLSAAERPESDTAGGEV